MQIDLRELADGQTHLTYEIPAPSVGLSPGELAVEGPLKLRLSLDRRGDEIWVRGKVQLVAHQECSRCLVEFPERLELEFEVFCAKVQNPNVVSSRAADEEDGGVHFHDGRVLIIDEEIREAVILGIPMKPLCKESCAGLCPRCGEDRNQGPCRCARAAAG
ncbi:MAG TPA: DUF177 domain-containing protein [Candidatus Eisenbacteria bacterium]|nr:DUF177 domain-containing protein [Candidatus Eisenbacteria bacterium]